MYRKMVILVLGMVGFSVCAWALDEEAAETLIRRSGCLKCHAMDKKKDGPALKEIAGKWRRKADAITKLSVHITTAPKVKINGQEEEHEMLKSTDPTDVKNVVEWFLSR